MEFNATSGIGEAAPGESSDPDDESDEGGSPFLRQLPSASMLLLPTIDDAIAKVYSTNI